MLRIDRRSEDTLERGQADLGAPSRSTGSSNVVDISQRQTSNGSSRNPARPRSGGSLKPPIPYRGAKIRLAQLLMPLLCQHRVYIEPFFGSGALFFAKRPAPVEIINDADDAVVTFFRVLREQPAELKRACLNTPHARTEFNRATLDDEVGDVELARRFWVRVSQSFAKGTERTGWSLTTGRHQATPATIKGRLERFEACAARLRNASIECCNAIELIERLARADAVLYVDPPYLGSVRVAGCGGYRHDMSTEAEHRALHATPAAVVLSGYRSPLYNELFAGWQQQVFLQQTNSPRSSRSLEPEVIWSNRPLPSARQLSLRFPAS